MSTRAGRREKELATLTRAGDTLLTLSQAGVLYETRLDLQAFFNGRDYAAEETLDLWDTFGRFLGQLKRSDTWWIADWLNFGTERFSESDRYAQVMDATGLSRDYLENVARIGRGIAPSRRLGMVRGKTVPFGLHEAVYTLTPDEQIHWLREATAGDPFWTQRELRDRIKAATQQGVLPLEDDGDGGNGHRPNVRRVVEVAELIHRQARVNGDEVIIPLETWRQLEAALGSGE